MGGFYITSQERKKNRYLRRKLKRELKFKPYSEMTFDDVFSLINLYDSGKKCCNGVRWKTSIIIFENLLFSNIVILFDELQSGTYKFSGFTFFITVEHGKARNINALKIRDRVVQYCIYKHLAIDAYSRSFIYDNSASLPSRGMHKAQKRLKQILRQHYLKYGLEGGILLFDFSGYFSSLSHQLLKEKVKKMFKDERIVNLLIQMIDDYKLAKDSGELDMDLFENEEEFFEDMGAGVGLGSPMSQIFALDFANPIDHYIKTIIKDNGSGRYMDDGWAVSYDLKILEELEEALFKLSKELKLKLNEKKVIIVPFKGHSFHFLKTRYRLQPNGKITMKLNRKSIKSIRRKLKLFREWLDLGIFTIEDVCSSYQSWRAYASLCDSYVTVLNMDNYFVSLFGEELKYRKNKFKCFLKAVKTKEGWIYYNHPSNKDLLIKNRCYYYKPNKKGR